MPTVRAIDQRARSGRWRRAPDPAAHAEAEADEPMEAQRQDAGLRRPCAEDHELQRHQSERAEPEQRKAKQGACG